MIPSGENFVILGDFNTRVGPREDRHEWWYVRGPHGYSKLNEVGRELLTMELRCVTPGFGSERYTSGPGNTQIPKSGTALIML